MRRTPSRPSTGPQPQLVRHGEALLVIDAMLPSGRYRPLPASLALLRRFSTLMAAEGRDAHVARMAFDRVYARERCSLAQRAADPALRALARQLIAVAA